MRVLREGEQILVGRFPPLVASELEQVNVPIAEEVESVGSEGDELGDGIVLQLEKEPQHPHAQVDGLGGVDAREESHLVGLEVEVIGSQGDGDERWKLAVLLNEEVRNFRGSGGDGEAEKVLAECVGSQVTARRLVASLVKELKDDAKVGEAVGNGSAKSKLNLELEGAQLEEPEQNLG